jgi:hypothetical protein
MGPPKLSNVIVVVIVFSRRRRADICLRLWWGPSSGNITE